MKDNHIAKASVVIHASREEVWNALVDPAAIKKYMFGADVRSQWKEGSKITWNGNWQGKAFEDKGVIKSIEPKRKLSYTHFSPLSQKEDVPENYHTISIALRDSDEGVVVELAQDNNSSEEGAAHAAKNWQMMLDGLRQLLEGTKRFVTG